MGSTSEPAATRRGEGPGPRTDRGQLPSPEGPERAAGRLDQLAHLALVAVPGMDDASVTLAGPGAGRAQVVAWTSAVALQLDGRQCELDAGPCVDAALTGEVVVVLDTYSEPRYPDFAHEARRAGVTRSLSVGLAQSTSTAGSLNLHSRSGLDVDPTAQAAARSVAAVVEGVVGDAGSYSRMEALVDQMQRAMASRSTIEQAKGIIIALRGCDPDEAFEELSSLASESERKLHVVAADIVRQRGRVQ